MTILYLQLRTPDLGGNATTLEVVQEIFTKIKEKTAAYENDLGCPVDTNNFN